MKVKRRTGLRGTQFELGRNLDGGSFGENDSYYIMLVKGIRNLSDEERHRKSIRHIHDSMNVRTPRHDIDCNYT